MPGATRIARALAVIALGWAVSAAAQTGKGKGRGKHAAQSDNPYDDVQASSAPPTSSAAAAAAATPAPPQASSSPAPSASPAAPPSPAAAVEPPAGATPPAAPPADDSDTRSAAYAAYQRALADKKLGPTAALSVDWLRDELSSIEAKIAAGRRDEAISDLVYFVESPRFRPFEKTAEGRAARFLLGDALGRGGAVGPARGNLRALLTGALSDTWYRRAARSLVDFGLESDQPERLLADLAVVPATAPEELRSDIAYLEGRAHERAQRPTQALAAYARVTPRSRFWAQATYLSGLIEVDRGRLKQGEQQFCKVADSTLTPKSAPFFGGSDFFRVRDLARLGLGRVAHEQYRFDDSRYYYYLVPHDSDGLPEALYESATSRYEAKDYRAARDLIDELGALDRSHAYEDEVWLLDAYVDLATCDFARADKKLTAFLRRYEPVRDAAQRLTKDPAQMQQLVEAVRTGADPASSGADLLASVARTLGALLRLDSAYATASMRLARLDHQLSGLRGAMGELDDVRRRLASPTELRPQSGDALSAEPNDELSRVDSQLDELRRLIGEARRARRADPTQIQDLERELGALELRARALRKAAPAAAASAVPGTDLGSLVADDREQATRLYAEAEKVRDEVAGNQTDLARDALVRLDRRLTRLLQRARLGRIETVLGQKRVLDVEVEALSQGLLPQKALDSLDAARFLRDDEEYWPFEGEDWEDEYVGGEGLR